jgi:hypothetical protein
LRKNKNKNVMEKEGKTTRGVRRKKEVEGKKKRG